MLHRHVKQVSFHFKCSLTTYDQPKLNGGTTQFYNLTLVFSSKQSTRHKQQHKTCATA